ncbi:MAG: hypothetical protein J7J70_06755, partial [Deltaproteobacteria bacterium]|nr:hypothetical protein [Candidatus Tharpellaceae bacterium]
PVCRADQEHSRELTLPLLETVRRFETDYAELDSERRQLKNDRQKTEKKLKTARDENREVAYGGEVPSEQDLEISRKRRQDGWKLLCRQWIDGDDVSAEATQYAPGQDLPDAYEQQVEKADLIADRLRREAERVSRAAALRARIESLEETMQGIILKEKEVRTRQQHLAAGWQAEWKSTHIKPLSPKEMLAWLSDMDRLRLQVTELFTKERLLSDKSQVRQPHRQALTVELKGLGESGDFSGQELEPVLLVAESILEKISRRKAEREKLSDQRTRAKTALNKARREQQEAETAKIEWQEKWDKALAGSGLKDQVLPGEAHDLLETIGNCFDKLEKVKEFQSRINGIDRDMAGFSADVRTLLAQAAPDLKDVSPEQAALQLHAMLGRARQDNELLKKNKLEMEDLTAEIENTKKILASLDERMAELLVTAGCNKNEDLAEAIRKSTQYQRLHEKISAA